jgi:hypothetical protein
MKLAPLKNYSFNASAKTVTLLDYTDIDLESILIITNLVTNTQIYNFAISGKGGTVLNNVLTLQFDTTVMNDSDTLQIYYDDSSRDLTVNNEGELRVTSEDNIAMLSKILTSLLPLTNTDSSQRTLQTVDSISAGVTLPTVTNVGTVATITNVGTVATITNPVDTAIGANGLGVGYDLYMMNLRSAYNTAILPK